MRRTALASLLLLATACSGGANPESASAGKATTFGVPSAPGQPTSIQLEGAEYGSGDRIVVISHEYPASQDAWAPFAKTLASKGYHVFTYNFPGYGISGGAKDPSKAALDLEVVVRYIIGDRGSTDVTLIGGSMGGTASLIVAAKLPLTAVISVSAPVSFMGLDATSSLESIKAPTLLLAGDRDPNGAADAARTMAARIKGATLNVIAGDDGHASGLVEGSHKSRVRGIILDFLGSHRQT